MLIRRVACVVAFGLCSVACVDEGEAVANTSREAQRIVDEALQGPDRGRAAMAKYCDHSLQDPLDAPTQQREAELEAQWSFYLDVCNRWLDEMER